MLIISQDGEKIYNLNNVKEIEIDMSSNWGKVSINADRKFLGMYNNLGRAKEVISEIAIRYSKGIRIYRLPLK